MFLRGSEVTSPALLVYFRLDAKVGGPLKKAMTTATLKMTRSQFVGFVQRSGTFCT